MILIKKSSEPKSWAAYRLTPGTKYEPNDDLREALLRDQGYMICCPGAVTSTAEKHTHCDRHKKETPISFSPLDFTFISTISYGTDGTIKSSDGKYSEEMDSVLNLNQTLLKNNRKEVWDAVIKALGNNDWKRSDLERILKKYTTRDSDGKFKEYCGIVIFLINKRLSRF